MRDSDLAGAASLAGLGFDAVTLLVPTLLDLAVGSIDSRKAASSCEKTNSSSMGIGDCDVTKSWFGSVSLRL